VPGFNGGRARFLVSSGGLARVGAAALGAALQGAWTLEAWLILDAGWSAQGIVASYFGQAYTSNYAHTILLSCGVRNDRVPFVNTYQAHNAGQHRSFGGAALDVGRLYHFAVTRTAQGGNLWTLRCYIDGALYGTLADVPGLNSGAITADAATHFISIGGNVNGSLGNMFESFRGVIDDVRLSSVARPVEEIAAVAASGLAADPVPDVTPPVLDFFPLAGDAVAADAPLIAGAYGVGEAANLIVGAELDGRAEVVFLGGAFAAGYAEGSAMLEADPGDVGLEIRRDDGWVGPVTLRSVAFDGAGNRTTGSLAVVAPAAPPPPPDPEPEPVDAVPPTVALVAPAAGAVILPNTPIEIDVLDDVELRRVFVAVEFPKSGFVELAFDGSSFSAAYGAESTRTPVAGGARFLLRRAGGWPSAPTVRAYPRDAAGNE
jgi:hypothetical protein